MAPSPRTLGRLMIAFSIFGLSTAQFCAVNVCPNSETCWTRPRTEVFTPASTFACECTTNYMNFDCGTASGTNNVTTCYGSKCGTGFFTSPNYPDLYTNRDRRLYLLFIPAATSITFYFANIFDVEEFKDELYIGPGLRFQSNFINSVDIPAEQVYFFEGNTAPNSFTLSNTDSAWMYFASDKNIMRQGFRIEWSVVGTRLTETPTTTTSTTINTNTVGLLASTITGQSAMITRSDPTKPTMAMTSSSTVGLHESTRAKDVIILILGVILGGVFSVFALVLLVVLVLYLRLRRSHAKLKRSLVRDPAPYTTLNFGSAAFDERTDSRDPRSSTVSTLSAH